VTKKIAQNVWCSWSIRVGEKWTAFEASTVTHPYPERIYTKEASMMLMSKRSQLIDRYPIWWKFVIRVKQAASSKLKATPYDPVQAWPNDALGQFLSARDRTMHDEHGLSKLGAAGGAGGGAGTEAILQHLPRHTGVRDARVAQPRSNLIAHGTQNHVERPLLLLLHCLRLSRLHPSPHPRSNLVKQTTRMIGNQMQCGPKYTNSKCEWSPVPAWLHSFKLLV